MAAINHASKKSARSSKGTVLLHQLFSLIDWLTDCVNGTKGGWFRCHSLQRHIWEQVGSQMSNVFYASITEPFKSSWLELIERVPQLEERTKRRQSPNKTQLLALCMSGDVCVLTKYPPDHKPFDISSQFRCSRHFPFHGSQNPVDSCMLFRGHNLVPCRIYAFSFLSVTQ